LEHYTVWLRHEYTVWLRDMGTKKFGTEVFGELRNVVLEENGEDKMVRELTTGQVLERIREDPSK
jgi:hypothetical protein